MIAIYDRVVATAAPVFIANTAHWSDRGYRVEQLALPLSNDGKNVAGIMDVTLPTLLPFVRSAGDLGETERTPAKVTASRTP